LNKKFVPSALLALYLIVFINCAIAPYDRNVWIAENAPIVLIAIVILIVSRFYVFTPTSYILMSVLIILHTIGGHYTFERVPFDFVTKLFGFERNNYDRVAHFSVGFYAFPIAELMLTKKAVRSKTVLLLFPIFTICAVAAGYEIFEWIYAVSADEEAGIAVLGSQGDVWDAQKDMLADSLGAIFAIIVFWLTNSKKVREIF
jgi:putative membrane protein